MAVFSSIYMNKFRRSLQERIAFLKLKSGDSDAFAFFYDQYVSRIYRFVLIKVADRQLAEDLTQDIFLKVWQHLVDKKNVRSFQAFIFRIARNTVFDYYRQSQKQELPLEYLEESISVSDGIILKIDQSLEAAQLIKAIRQLKPEYQEVLILRYVEEMSIDDISQIVQKDKNNVRVSIHRALNKLKAITQAKK